MHVLGFDPHAFAHFRDERKRRRSQVNVTLPQVLPSLMIKDLYALVFDYINFEIIYFCMIITC